ncbi:MAG TPA: hypothetical protein VE843_13625 [Ktedonobacteraceae bacterium]|nr:hypothetical protein [Ktedonobacteraceae bacterium]
MEDQILTMDSMEGVTSDENPFKKLLKKEQRLTAKLEEEREAEARAQDRFQRAQTRLQRRRKRLERIQRKLLHVREELAALQITDQFTVHRENELVVVPAPESTTYTYAASEEVTLIQPEQNNVVAQVSDDFSSTYIEYPAPDSEVSDQENTSINMSVSYVPAVNSNEEMAHEQEFSLPQQENTSPAPFTNEPIEAPMESELETTDEERSEEEHFEQQEATSPVSLPSMSMEAVPTSEVSPSSEIEDDTAHTSPSEPQVAQELETSSPSTNESSIPSIQEQEPVATLGSKVAESEAEVIGNNDLASETSTERKPTQPLRIDQPDLSAAMSHASDVPSAREAWIAAESAMQNIRNAANGIATSISFLSQTDGLSNEFMEELVRKQADANRELLKAQDAARAAYERFVQAQREAQTAAQQSINTSDGSSQEKQEDTALPAAEENGLDQTAKLHAVRLYTEW